jgi:intracellular sulfur oxidation DsrE/DsrF family protein
MESASEKEPAMRRRNLLGFFALALAAPAAGSEEKRAMRVVYQINDADKVATALANMRNHHAGGPQGIQLAAVVYGPALAAFRVKADDAALAEAYAAALNGGDKFFACANTLAAHRWTLKDLLPGFALAESGGVVKLADLQAQGWAYLRP